MNPPVHSKSPIEYEHQYLVDSFFDVDGTDRDKVRVTRDERTGEVLQCIQKKRLGNLDVHSPKRAADWRVSVMIEVPGMFT
jgi:polynucleotide 5'-triphosphatase